LQKERARASLQEDRFRSLEADLAQARKREQELREQLDARAPSPRTQ
jgi:hypothetical protein